MARRGRPSRLAVFDRFNGAVADLYNTVGSLPLPIEGEEIWEGIWYEETHNSTALEGNTLILREVKTLLEEGRAVGEKELREYLEVQGYAEAAKWVYRHAFEEPVHDQDGTARHLISLAELREIHRLTVEPVWRHFPPADHDSNEGPGSFRRHDIEAFPSGMKPPPWPDVAPQITDWVSAANVMIQYYTDWLSRHSSIDFTDPARHPVAMQAGLHAHFERIHPFRDGNGRTGRLALNLMLVRMLYPPVVIYKRDRPKYLKALERADKGDPCPLGELLARALIHSIDRFLLPNLAGPQRLVRLSALADRDLSLIALRRAAERGRLRAQRRNDQWYSTRKWVDEYKASRRRGRAVVPQAHPDLLAPKRPSLEAAESQRLF
jgi:cell filamentation protein, protein adenylyltransferase